MNRRSPRYLPAPPPLVAVGQRIHCILYGGQDGTIFAIHGEQQPATCGSIGGGVMLTEGNACFDIVWDDGTRSLQIPEALARGSVQWAFLDQPLATPDEIRQHQAEADAETARRTEAEQRRHADYLARKETLRAVVYQFESSSIKATISSMLQTWSATPASIAGVTRSEVWMRAKL